MERPRIIDIVGHGPHAACDRRNCSGLMIALDEHERGRFNRTITVATGDSDRSIGFRASSFAFSSPAFSEVTFP
jgi:hypothetical protein